MFLVLVDKGKNIALVIYRKCTEPLLAQQEPKIDFQRDLSSILAELCFQKYHLGVSGVRLNRIRVYISKKN